MSEHDSRSLRILRALFAVLIVGFLLSSTVAARTTEPAGVADVITNENVPMRFAQPVILMMAVGSAPAVNAMIANSMARAFQQTTTTKTRAWSVDSWVTPEPTWSLTDFVAQCKNFDNQSNIRGAFIALPASISTGQNNFLGAYQRTHTQVSFDVFFTTCEAAVADGGISMAWQTGVQQAQIFRNSYSLVPLGLLVSLYTLLAPTRSSSSVTTTVYPTPLPLSPGGAISLRTNTSTTTANGNGGGGTGAAFLSGIAAFSGNALGSISVAGQQTEAAIDRISGDVVKDVKCSCTDLRDRALSEKEREHCLSAQSTPPPDPPFCAWIHSTAK